MLGERATLARAFPFCHKPFLRQHLGDDFQPPWVRHSFELESVELTPGALSSADCVVIVTDHTSYDPDFLVEHARLVVDSRNLTRGVREGRERIVRA